MKIPKLKINKKGKITDIRGKEKRFKVNDQVILRQSNYPEKVFVLQELWFDDGKKEIRIGYYIIGKKGRARGKWTWGQFCPFFPKKDLIKLIQKAKFRKII